MRREGKKEQKQDGPIGSKSSAVLFLMFVDGEQKAIFVGWRWVSVFFQSLFGNPHKTRWDNPTIPNHTSLV